MIEDTIEQEAMQTAEEQKTSALSKPIWKTKWSKKLLLNTLKSIQGGQIHVIDGEEKISLGGRTSDDLEATVTVLEPKFYTEAVWGGNLGAAEAYLQGLWSCDDLTKLVRIFARNLDVASTMNKGVARIAGLAARVYHRMRDNSVTGSKKNIHEHYDLGNDFFSLFLDPTMMYSSGCFESPETTMEEASIEKIDRICRKLKIKESDHLLEIGTGWGGFAEYAAKNYGCKITTTTISEEQFKLANERIKKAGLQNRVKIILEDYRDLNGQYDKIVSIEMIEAVGDKYFNTYFKKCGELLKPGGLMVLQAITIPDQRYADYIRSTDFIQRYIFPGGCLPSVNVMSKCVSTQSNMEVVDLEDFAPSYARTLQLWRDRFFERIDEVREQGFSERFIRMWDYYLCYCEAAFLERATGVVQMMLAKPGDSTSVWSHYQSAH